MLGGLQRIRAIWGRRKGVLFGEKTAENTEPEFPEYPKSTLDECLQIIIDAKKLIKNVESPEDYDGRMQYSHNPDAYKPEDLDVNKPAMTDCCYGPHFDRYRVSIGYSAYTPEAKNLVESLKSNYADKTVLHPAQLCEALETVFEHCNLKHQDCDFGYYYPTAHRYLEWMISQEDFEKGKAIIGAIVNSKADNPRELRAKIDQAVEPFKNNQPGPEPAQ